jgi:hypothetical protein
MKILTVGRDVTSNGSAYAGQLFTRQPTGSVQSTELPPGGRKMSATGRFDRFATDRPVTKSKNEERFKSYRLITKKTGFGHFFQWQIERRRRKRQDAIFKKFFAPY